MQADPGLVDRLRRDAAATARLEHPHVVRTLGMGQSRGDAFLVSEWVGGATLAELLDAKGRLERHEVVFVAIACARALEAGQQRGMTHGAIEPGSVAVAQDGTVKLAGVGLTKPPIREVSITSSGDGVRSPHGLSPEHLDREPALDVRADLFSLGALLYRCLTGQQPFGGDTTGEVVFAIRDGDVRPVRRADPEAPQALAAVIEKCLRPDPADRYQTPAELIADLEAYQAGRVPEAQRAAIAAAHQAKAEAAEPERPPEPEQPPRRRAWLWLSAAGAAVLALALGGIWLATRTQEEPPPEVEQPVQPETADPVLLARRGREEIEAIVEADASQQEQDPERRTAAIEDTIRKLEDAGQRYEGTAAAEEARQRLIPLRAEALFQTARAHAREHPQDAAGIARRFREVTERYPETAAALKAEQELDALEGLDRKKLQRAMAEVRERADTLAEAERFGEALAEWDKLLGSITSESLRQQVLKEKIDITSRAEAAYEQVHEQARAKVRARLFGEAKALYQRVVDRYGVEPYVGQARGEMAIIEPLLASAATRRVQALDAAKYEFFLTRLEPSLAEARGWQLDAAQTEAETLRPTLRDAGIEAYLDDYLSDLALLRSLKAKVIRRLNDRGQPVHVRQFSFRKAEQSADLKQWLAAQVLSADHEQVIVHYKQLKVRRPWEQFRPDELYKLGRLAIDHQEPHGHLLLGVHCLYTGLLRTAKRELEYAEGGGLDAEPYLKRLEHTAPAEPGTRREPTEDAQAEASRLFSEARRLMERREWDRALYRLALLRQRHATEVYDVSANLDDINRRIVACKPHVAKLLMQTDLTLGHRVLLTRDDLFGEWETRFGDWSIRDGVVHGEMVVDPGANGEGGGDHDAECLFSLQHPYRYELRCKVRVRQGPGALLRLAGKARPNLGFWVHAANPKLVGILHAYKSDEKPAEHAQKPFAFKPDQWYEIRALVTPAEVEVAVEPDYLLRRPNTLPADPAGVCTYGFLVNPHAAADFRDFSVRVLQEQ